jgi:hypothetical protein
VEHTGEDDLIQRGRTKVELGLTEVSMPWGNGTIFFWARIHVSMLIALGDAMALPKVPLDRYGY